MLTNGPVVVVDGIALPDGVAATNALLDALTAIAPPVLDTWHPGGAVDALATHMDPDEPGPAWTAHDLLASLPDAAIDAVVASGTGPTPLLVHELRQLGGAIADPRDAGGFVDRFTEPFLLNLVAIAPEPAALDAAQAAAAALHDRLADVVTDRCAPTFLDSATDPRPAGDPAAMERLRRLRAEADPAGTFSVRP